jgi:hypothetical protein
MQGNSSHKSWAAMHRLSTLGDYLASERPLVTSCVHGRAGRASKCMPTCMPGRGEVTHWQAPDLGDRAPKKYVHQGYNCWLFI